MYLFSPQLVKLWAFIFVCRGWGIKMLKILFACAAGVVGFLFGLYFPDIVNSLIVRKCGQKGRELPGKLEFGNTVKLAVSVGFFFVFSGISYQIFSARSLFLCAFVAITAVATVIDHKIRIIPNEICLALVVFGLAYRFLVNGIYGLLESVEACALVIGIFLIYYVIFCRRKGFYNGIGAGDIKLALSTAVVVGFPAVMTSLLYMSAALIIYCVGGLLLKKLTLTSLFPMCGFIMIGFLFGVFAA
ncbi:prepilin peptidase [Caproiciproducens galactitolivorans]|uniref:Type IV leader peptidase family protein n=2 Tax=Caproiciproducens galactitolivorans TaxID=642589 RepID=A0A4Z0YF54_9FIRM|nr:prepilin peptidase [Caproiciproducens galactitolivorans]TGJ77403.1 type IV leader peptidase family protein [Caproiciproducens galactitolivorans]